MKVKTVLETLLQHLEASQGMQWGHPVIYFDMPLDHAQTLQRFLRRCLDPEVGDPGEPIGNLLETH